MTRAKDTLRLLFVVSRPEGVGFLDPRADALPILDAIDEHAPGRVVCEFLRPATLDGLLERLEDTSKPAVDIVHFDGTAYLTESGLPAIRRSAFRSAKRALREGRSRNARGRGPANTAICCSRRGGEPHFVSADDWGEPALAQGGARDSLGMPVGGGWGGG
jgi:hypothetical protein